MKLWILLFIAILLYKISANASALIRLRYYRKKYERFLTKQDFNFEECAPAVLKLFKSAGIKDSWIPFAQPVGYGMLHNGHASFFSNLASADGRCIELMRRGIAEAKGVFKGRILEALSPFYWIEFVIYLPRNILRYLGIDTGGLLSKVLQLLYWILTPLLIAFRDQFYLYITELFG